MTSLETVHHCPCPFAGTCVQYIRELEETIEQLRRQLVSSSPSRNESHLVFQLEHPEQQSTSAKSSSTARYDQTISAILARTPACLSEWSHLSRDAKLSTREEVLDAFETLTLRSSSPPLAVVCTPRTEPTHTVVQAYSGLQSFLQRLAKNSTQLANYSSLLFFCICLVARKNGMSVEDVDNFATGCLPSGRSSKYLRNFRKTAGLVARAIDRSESERGHLCSLLFMSCCPPMSTLDDLADRSGVIDRLFARVTKKTEWLKKEACVSVSFNPAFLLTYLGEWTLHEVNSGLGTHLSPEGFRQRKRYVEQELADCEEETREATPGRTAKRQKIQQSARERSSSLPDENSASSSLEQEVARVDSGRRPSSSSDLCAPTTAGTLSAHSDGRIHTPRNGMPSPPPSSAVGLSTPDHAVEAVASKNLDNANSFNRQEVDLFSQEPHLNLQQNIEPHDTTMDSFFSELDAELIRNSELNTYQFDPWDIYGSPSYDEDTHTSAGR